MEETGKNKQITVPEDTVQKWQATVDLLAQIIDIPAALIMRLVETDIEVFVSSKSQGNPYQPGDNEHFMDSGLYCETVIKRNEKLVVPNALKDPNWDQNPDIKLNMISYLGYPINQPDGSPFGTICVLDNKENRYSETFEQLLLQFRDVIQGHLELLYLNQQLGDKNQQLTDYIEEIQTLRGIIPICASCKNIRDDDGYWQAVEKYISDRSHATFSHGICPECIPKLYPEFKDLVE